MMKKPITSSYPPVSFVSTSGKRYVVGSLQWIEVPLDFSMDRISEIMVWEGFKNKSVNHKIYPVVSSSNPDITYKVRLDPKHLIWSCDCPGFMYRRKKICKHIKHIQNGRK